jgi:hypothetical protein
MRTVYFLIKMKKLRKRLIMKMMTITDQMKFPSEEEKKQFSFG